MELKRSSILCPWLALVNRFYRKAISFILSVLTDWKVGSLQCALWYHLCLWHFSAELESGRKAFPRRGGGEAAGVRGRAGWGSGANARFTFMRCLPPPPLLDWFVCTNWLPQATHYSFEPECIPGDLTAFPLPSNCPFPKEDAGNVGHFPFWHISLQSPHLPLTLSAVCKALWI